LQPSAIYVDNLILRAFRVVHAFSKKWLVTLYAQASNTLIRNYQAKLV